MYSLVSQFTKDAFIYAIQVVVRGKCNKKCVVLRYATRESIDLVKYVGWIVRVNAEIITQPVVIVHLTRRHDLVNFA